MEVSNKKTKIDQESLDLGKRRLDWEMQQSKKMLLQQRYKGLFESVDVLFAKGDIDEEESKRRRLQIFDMQMASMFFNKLNSFVYIYKYFLLKFSFIQIVFSFI